MTREGDALHFHFGTDTTYATLHFAAEPRPYVYPLLGPSGASMTRGYPMEPLPGEAQDHPHHQSFWFAHGDVNGFDFWHGTGRGERIVSMGVEVFGPPVIAETGLPELGSAGVKCHYEWRVEGDRVLCTEMRFLWFHRREDRCTVDVHVVLTPVGEPLVLGDTKEGSFALRLHPALRVEGDLATGVLRNSEGQENREAWGKRARWIDDSGTIDGQQRGVAIFDHPTNPRHPTWWHARTYGLVAANPFGIHDFEGSPDGTGDLAVPLGEELELFYRVVLHEGWDAPQIEAAYEEWIDTFPSPPAGVRVR